VTEKTKFCLVEFIVDFADPFISHFMGHGNSNKLYITHEEHTGKFGSHSASVGYKLYANPVFQMFSN